MAAPLLTTKLYIPPIRPELVSRPRLIERLNEGLHRKLTLVSAPAGSGKTTLLSEWVLQCGRPIAWVSLDDEDNDLTHFLTYLIAALQTIKAKVAESVLAALQSPQPPPTRELLIALTNQIDSLQGGTVLVLDDYHVIKAQLIHDALSYVLDHLPARMHLVVATRADPPLPIARLRGRGQLTELRRADLRFTLEETQELLRQIVGSHLSAEDIATLEARTEGWVAGLQMAAFAVRGMLSAQDQRDVSQFIRAFSGSHRYIMDYLLGEVIGHQPEAIREFLLHTCILERLSGRLCEAVMGWEVQSTERETGSTTADSGCIPSGQHLLETLERANLFLVPLDGERRWYRYHHLFADLLRARLARYAPELIVTLHERASEWYERHGLVDEAIHHALAANDFSRAARLVQCHWLQIVHDGYVSIAFRWLHALPEDLIRESMSLSVARCWTLFLRGQITEMAARLKDALQRSAQPGASELPADHPADATLPAQIANLQSIAARHSGDFGAAVAHAHRALELIPAPDVPWLGTATLSLGLAYRGAGDLAKASQACAEALPLLRASGNFIAAMIGVYYLANIHQMQGNLRQAAEVCREALQHARQERREHFPAYGMVHVALADVLREWNQLEEAEHHLFRGMEIGEQGGYLEVLKSGNLALARLKQAKGDASGALAAIQQADRVARRIGTPLALTEIAAQRARLLVQQGKVAEAASWAERSALDMDAGAGVTDLVATVGARVLIAQDRLDKAAERLTQLFAAADTDGRLGNAIEVLVLRALALRQQGHTEQALADLERALTLAEPEGYVRVFADEGPRMGTLLVQFLRWQRRGRRSARHRITLDYVRRLLLAFPERTREMSDSTEYPALSLAHRDLLLVDPLTDRELEVLRLMARGMTNREIAQKLVVASGTVKAHAASIYRKLDVHNRTQAVTLARELELI
jgi:LuxR family maltose regulon positive regulatory protein